MDLNISEDQRHRKYLCFVINLLNTKYICYLMNSVLMEVNVPILKNLDCQEKYLHRLPDTVMCAGAPGADACQGDSGESWSIMVQNKH